MATDHYAEAERLLGAVGNTADAEDRRQCLAEAQVHATLAFVQWQRRTDVKHTNREAWRSESQEPGAHIETPAESPGYVSIPWPPSDELVERVARVLYGIYSPNRIADYEDITDPRPWRAAAGMVLAEVGGDGDE